MQMSINGGPLWFYDDDQRHAGLFYEPKDGKTTRLSYWPAGILPTSKRVMHIARLWSRLRWSEPMTADHVLEALWSADLLGEVYR